MSEKVLHIGLDPGVKTGIAIWNADIEKFESLQTVSILDAIDIVTKNRDRILLVTMEDARLWRYGTDPNRAQGAGSIKRDCSIWEMFLKQYDIPHLLVKPNNKFTKINAKTFQAITKFAGKCSEHARDAAMLVYKKQL
jgi:hypothetical protein